MSERFDVVVLGGGVGGYVAAIRASQLGKSVAVIERKYWGGVCLNVGCIPSKALLRNAEVAHLIEHEARDVYGVTVGDVSLDYSKAYERSRTVSDGRVKGVHFLMKKNKIKEYDGWGEFTDANTLRVTLNDGGEETVTFDNCVVATGATTKL
ncbi:MAG TPA: FAD-dependent oxidoreductase, partial [Nocardioidaceae bacterium]|nr:FAD-dependent oxidoreductase [Nocardioidaceae bacterium]